MKVAIRLFAGLRELAGTRAIELELPTGATAADIWPTLELGAEPNGLLIAINKRYAARDTVLVDGDEVAARDKTNDSLSRHRVAALGELQRHALTAGDAHEFFARRFVHRLDLRFRLGNLWRCDRARFAGAGLVGSRVM